MDPTHPPELAALLDGRDPAARDAAWAAFLSRYHRLLFKVAASLGGGYDDRMDRYGHIVEALASDDFRCLRGYHPQSRSSFPAWLTVVTRRLCVDHARARFGRADRTSARSRESRRVRRSLADLAGQEINPDSLASSGDDPVRRLEREERRAAVERAIAALPTRDRLLLRLRFEDDLSVREIASLMAFPTVFHVYRRLRHVLPQLQRDLSQHAPEASE